MPSSGHRGGRRDTRRQGRGALRPTAARVRDALFNSLRGSIEGVSVLDLFAGTGALGLEALRRGAARIVLVERDRRYAAALRARVAAEGLERDASVRCEDAADAIERLGREGDRFGLILLDPPYGEGWLPRALAAIVRAGLLAPGGLVVAEGHWRDRPEAPEGLALTREARYGETVLWYFRDHTGRDAGEE
jgi:16S rRNA (guanine(966)-N(2))-methyltransferase RsmD